MTARDPLAITGVGTAPSGVALPEAVRARAARAERVPQLALGACGAALAAAGLAVTDGAPRPRVGIVLGTAYGCFLTNAAFQRGVAARGQAGASPRAFAATVSNAAAGEVAIAYRLGGPSVTLTAGAAAGSVALGHALDLLRRGDADALVAAAVDAVGAPLADWLPAGATAGEGGVAVVIERAAAAAARGAAVRGWLLGHGLGFEAEPGGGAGLAAAVDGALAEAGVTRGTVDGVVAVEAVLAADGPRALLAGLAADTGTVLLTDVCPSGHVAAVVARSAA